PMSPLMHHQSAVWQLPVFLTLALLFTALVYVRGWLRLRSPSFQVIGGWRAVSFLLGVFLIWIAVASPLASGDVHLLTVHMLQHLLLMSLAPPLIWLGEPLRPLLWGLPRPVGERGALAVFHCGPIQRPGAVLSHPAVCWTAATAALAAWHVPAVFTLGMHSET